MRAVVFVLMVTALVACRKKSMYCGTLCDYNEVYVFGSGFNNTVLTDGQYQNALFSGVDTSCAAPNDWSVFDNLSSLGSIHIGYEDGDNTQRFAKIIDDPDSVGNKVMQFCVKEPHIWEGTQKKGRVQLYIGDNPCAREIYQTVRMKLDPDMAFLKAWEEKVSWLTVFEFWNNANWTKEKHTFRVTVNLFKQEGANNDIHFHVKGDKKPNCAVCAWNKVWEQENTDFALPFGTWVDVELYLREGDADNGRFFMAVTPENGNKQAVFDIRNTTQHPDETCPDGFSQFQPMKLYTSDDLINYMKDAGKNLSIYWDDWRLFLNKQP